MSSASDNLKILKSIDSTLKDILDDNKPGTTSRVSNLNVQAAKVLSEHMSGVETKIVSADQHMQSFLATADAAAEGMKNNNKLLEITKGTLSTIDRSFGNTFSNMFKKTGIEKISKEAVNSLNAIRGWKKALGEAQNGFQKTNIAIGGISAALGKVTSGLFQMIPVIGGLAEGVFSLGIAITKSIVGAFTSALTAAAKFTKFIFTLPIGIANVAAEIGNELRQELVEVIGQAVENTKELFDMASNGGSAFVRLGNIAKGSLLSFQSVNSTMTKLFGFGAQGAANMVSAVTKNIDDMGLFADVFAKSTTRTGKSIEFITRMTKGMGMQGDDLNYVVREAMKNGEHYFQTMTRMKEASDSVSSEFGLNRKLLSKNFFQLRKDITNFGHLSDIELQRVAARATQLGVEMKDLAGVFNKFGTFEDAANSAALLSQTFGMNIDALQLIRAEDPMEIVEMLRNAMMATGRSFDDLNRHEKALMATHTGMSVETLKTAMNYRNVGKSYEEIKKIMNDQKPEERQIRAMKDMRSSMSEIQKIMARKDFFTAFTDGLSKTILYGTKLGKTYRSISKNMENFYEKGLTIDKKKLDKILKPFDKILNKINEAFSSKSLRKLANSILDNLGEFVEDILNPQKCLTAAGWQKVYRKWDQKIQNLFNLESLLNDNSFLGKITGATGKIIGMILRAFVAAGPGLIKGIGGFIRKSIEFVFTGDLNVFGKNNRSLMKFLGFENKKCWEDFKKSLKDRFKDVTTYLFGGEYNKPTIDFHGNVTYSLEKREGLFRNIGNTLSKGFFGEDGKSGLVSKIASFVGDIMLKLPWEEVGAAIMTGMSSAVSAAASLGENILIGLGRASKKEREAKGETEKGTVEKVGEATERGGLFSASLTTITEIVKEVAKLLPGGQEAVMVVEAVEDVAEKVEDSNRAAAAVQAVKAASKPGYSKVLDQSIKEGFKGGLAEVAGQSVKEASEEGLKQTVKEAAKGAAKTVAKAFGTTFTVALEVHGGELNKEAARILGEKEIEKFRTNFNLDNYQIQDIAARVKKAQEKAAAAQNKNTATTTGGGLVGAALAGGAYGAFGGPGGALAGALISGGGYLLGSKAAKAAIKTKTAQEVMQEELQKISDELQIKKNRDEGRKIFGKKAMLDDLGLPELGQSGMKSLPAAIVNYKLIFDKTVELFNKMQKTENGKQSTMNETNEKVDALMGEVKELIASLPSQINVGLSVGENELATQVVSLLDGVNADKSRNLGSRDRSNLQGIQTGRV